MFAQNNEDYRILRVVCSDQLCQNIIYVSSLETEIDCFQCGQKHERNSLRDVQEVCSSELTNGVLDLYIRRLLINNSLPKRGTEMVKVLGLSNYYCKLLSPFLTRYGMDKDTGQARLLKDMNRGDIFDCSLFGDRAFLIDPEHIRIPGFGRDITGSMDYLSETLKLIISFNGGEERLLPIHADGDGHCLVHAISRALVGRELFWHPLRCCLKRHFECNLDKYKELFKDFIDTEEWQSIIDECDPEFKPPEGELHGLRNIHIFGLANVLKRPIVLLDSLECMKKCGDYSALFLPGFVDAEGCKGRDNILNKPICIAWSSYSHNHYIPLVGSKNMPLPVLPLSLLPKVWGMPQSEISTYMEFDDSGNCTIGGSRGLSDNYIQRLVSAMESQFYEEYGIHPTLVADTKLFLYSDNALLNTKVTTVIQRAKAAVADECLFRCSSCKALCEMRVDPTWLRHGGILYNSLLHMHKKFIPGNLYEMPVHRSYRLCCRYDAVNDMLVPDKNSNNIEKCVWCQSTNLAKLKADGSLVLKSQNEVNKRNVYSNQSPSKSSTSTEKQAQKEDLPRMLTLRIQWNDVEAEDVIPDFQLVKKEGLGEAVAYISSSFISKHFPDHVNNVSLQTYVAEEILRKIGKSTVFEFAEPIVVQKEEKKESSKEIKKEPTIDISTNVTAPSTSNKALSEPKSKPSISEPQTVKVVSSSGQQANLTLCENGITYTKLQEWISDQFSIPVPNQCIKIGFPPKELEAPVNCDTQALPLKHGDRLMVENCPKQVTNRLAGAPYVRNPDRDFSSQNPYSAYQNDVIWSCAKMNPEEFRKGGKVYEEVARSRILFDMIHVFIDAFPNKTFSYNGKTDSLELCVKPLGHFEICVDIDSRIEQVQEGESVNGYRKCPVMSLKAGHKDPIINKTLKKTLPSTAQASSETHAVPLVRKGPGFSILTSPESSDRMDVS